MTDALGAIRAGKPVILPTDTVYGLVASALTEAAVLRLYEAKGRDLRQPSALLAPDLEGLFDCLPELRGRPAAIVRALLPGPYTLILPNPAHHFRRLTGGSPDAIGVRVPELPEQTRGILVLAGCVVATSANLPGGAEPRRIDEIPAELLERVAAVVDGGELPGVPSTVIDFSGHEPRVVREGAAPSADAIGRAAAALA